MTTQPDRDLRTTLHRIADSTAPLPVDDDLWQRAQAARRRGQVLAVAAVLALVVSVGGVAAMLTTTDREARTASSEVVKGGAIPSSIEDPTAGRQDPALESDLAIGRASVAFLSTTVVPVVVGATDGRYHLLDLPDLPDSGSPLALSPDGRRLAWASPTRLHVVDLETGDVLDVAHYNGHGAVVASMFWLPDSTRVRWFGTADGEPVFGQVDITGPSEQAGPDEKDRQEIRGIPSPTDDFLMVRSAQTDPASVQFLQQGDGPGGGPYSRLLSRKLPADLYPGGAEVTPLGWAGGSLVVAQLYGPPGSYVEGYHLALFTSPDRPEAEWTYRIVARDIPQKSAPLSLAVDLIPDLDGTSSQQLTHDFGDTMPQRDISWMIGLGVAAAIAVLMGLRRLWRRLVRR